MITHKDCFKKYGAPENESNMVLYDVLYHNKILALPKRIYCNIDLIEPLERALYSIVFNKLENQIKSWDGCFNIRKKRGNSTPSLHSWGVAIDINAAWNQFGQPPTMSKELVQCFKDAGFDWGGDWSKPDGMHFQLSSLD